MSKAKALVCFRWVYREVAAPGVRSSLRRWTQCRHLILFALAWAFYAFRWDVSTCAGSFDLPV